MKASLALLTVIVISTARKGFALATFVDPPSGSTIARLEGAMNAATLACNVTSSDTPNNMQTFTEWFVRNLRGNDGLQVINDNFFPEIFSVGGDPLPTDPTRTFRNQLTLLNFTAELDGITIFCGTGGVSGNREQANFYLRVYRPPMLRDNVVLKVRENGGRIPVNISEGLAAFPEPTSQWSKDGQPLDGSRPELTYSTVTFDNVRRSDAGNYTVVTTNYALDSTTEQVGNDTGSFYLDVLFGPILTPGPLRRYILLNNSLSLVCGTGLDSNPQAEVTWMAPDGTTIMDNARYDLENGPQFVRLNFTHTIPSDSGIWKCQILVASEQYIVSGGQLVQQDLSPIGQIMVDIELVFIAPPGSPLRLNVDSSTATSFAVCWEAPLEFNSPISFYTVSAQNLNDTGGDDTSAHVVTRNTTNNSTFFNVTGLLPGTTYELTVVAVSQGGDVVAKSQASEPVVSTTGLTVPAPTCSAPLSSNGVITVTWSYSHTGGLPLTNVSVVYRFEEGASISPPTDVDIDNVEVTIAMVSNLIAGRFYTFTVTAENSIGSTSIDCDPIRHRVGVPAMPSFGELTAGPDPGQVTIQIKTIASGLSDRDARGFEFVLVPILDGVPGNELRFPRPDYQSGTLETITISNLSPGQSYTFIATAVNFFGISSPANSVAVRAAGLDPVQPSPGSDGGNSNAGAIIGGVVGVLLSVVFIIIITATVAISIRLRYYSKGHSKSVSNEIPLYDEPDNFRRDTANASDIEVKDCPAYDKVQKETHIELEQCPAYGEI